MAAEVEAAGEGMPELSEVDSDLDYGKSRASISPTSKLMLVSSTFKR